MSHITLYLPTLTCSIHTCLFVNVAVICFVSAVRNNKHIAFPCILSVSPIDVTPFDIQKYLQTLTAEVFNFSNVAERITTETEADTNKWNMIHNLNHRAASGAKVALHRFS